MTLTRSVLLLLALLAVSAPAGAQAVTISAPGTYNLAGDVSAASGAVVAINADSVVLNLNGKTIRCTSTAPSTAVTFGVTAGSRTNITIKNGSITGCFFGVNASYGAGIVLEDVTFTGNTYIGANLGYGVNNIVRRCVFKAIGGYTPEAYAIGLNGIGQNGLVEFNTFENIYRQPTAAGAGEGVGLLVEQTAVGVIVRQNIFKNAELRPNTIALWAATGAGVTASSNTVTNFYRGFQGSGLTITGGTFELTAALAGSVAVMASSWSVTGATFIGYDTALSADGVVDGGGNVIRAIGATPAPAGRWFRICVDAATCFEGILSPPGGH